MSQCVEREEEGSDRPESPTSSCVSMKSDRSKGKPPEPGPSHTQTKRPAKPTTDDKGWKCRRCWIKDWRCRGCGYRNTAEDLRCGFCISTSWLSITALPLSAADMRKSWHKDKDITQYSRDLHVRMLVRDMSTEYPAEDSDLVTDVQNIERNIYESANSEEEYCDLVREKRSELMETKLKLMSMGTGGHDSGSSSSDSGSGSSIGSYSGYGTGLSLSYDSITALPLSAADMMKSWHKDFTQKGRDLHVRSLVRVMSTEDPDEDFNGQVTDAQNIERNIYESANSREEYFKLMNEKRSELREKSQMKMEMKQSGQMEMKSMAQTSTPPLPPEDKVKKQEEEDEEGGAEGGSKQVKGQPDVKMEDKPEGTIPLHGEMEDHPVTESQSSLHRSLELQDENDLSSCFSGLRIEESISLPRSHSLPSLSQIPGLENKTSFRAKRSHSVNDVTLLDKTQKITPDIIVLENEESYRIHCTQAGLFQCNVTDLVFKMKTEGDVTYRTVHWDRRLLAQLGMKRPAGPLFDIKGSQGSVCQLRFPHCEILSMGGGKSLSVVHVMDDGHIELIKPHMITETHVIIDVTGLSLFGVITEIVYWSLVQPSPVKTVQPSPVQTVQHSPVQTVQYSPVPPSPVQTVQHSPVQTVQYSPVPPSPVQTVPPSPVQPSPVQTVQHSPVPPSPVQTVPPSPVQPSPVQTVQHSPVQPSPVQTVQHSPVPPSPVQTVPPSPVQPSPVQPSPVQTVPPSPVQPSPIRTLVSLFYTPPIEDDPSSILKVLLLPENVVLSEVKNERRKMNGEEIYIEMPPCELIPKQEYTLSTSTQNDSIIILPDKSRFKVDESSYENYNAIFVINLEERFENVMLLLSNSKTSICEWKGYVKLSAAALKKEQVQHTQSLPVEDRLFSVRSSFIDSVSDPVLNRLLDKLFQKKVILKEEYDTAYVEPVKHKKARSVIDTVRSKGTAASSIMILFLCETDPFLAEHLRLM